jgi:hypothetical protein
VFAAGVARGSNSMLLLWETGSCEETARCNGVSLV